MCPYHQRHRPHGMPNPANLPDMKIDENTPQPYRVFHALRGVLRAQKLLMITKLGEKDTHMGQAFTLWVLAKNDGISQSDLADMLNVRRPTVTIMIRKMEKAGLVERCPDEHDRRVMRVHMTAAGRELHARLEAVHAEVVRTTVGDMSEDEQRELERLLRIVEKNLEPAQ